MKAEDCCYIKTVDGKHLLFMPDGTQVKGVTLTSVHQGMDDVFPKDKDKFRGAHAKIELYVILK